MTSQQNKNKDDGMNPVTAAAAGAIIGAGVAAGGVLLTNEKNRKKIKGAVDTVQKKAEKKIAEAEDTIKKKD